MLGAFSSQWTLRAASDLRFSFIHSEDRMGVLDRVSGQRWWVAYSPDQKDLTEYVVVARPSGPVGIGGTGESARE